MHIIYYANIVVNKAQIYNNKIYEWAGTTSVDSIRFVHLKREEKNTLFTKIYMQIILRGLRLDCTQSPIFALEKQMLHKFAFIIQTHKATV